jgi:hypothetical protein
LADGDRLDLSAVLPGFGPGDDLADFVALDAAPGGTALAVAPGGDGGFAPLALLEGVALTLDHVTPAQLGLDA